MPISPLPGHLLVDAPQVVVGQLLRRWHLEGRNDAALRVERLHHLLDGAVLAGGIDALQDDQHRSLRLGPEAILQVGQPLELLRGGFLGGSFLPAPGGRRIDLRQVDACPCSDTQRFAQLPDPAHAIALHATALDHTTPPANHLPADWYPTRTYVLMRATRSGVSLGVETKNQSLSWPVHIRFSPRIQTAWR